MGLYTVAALACVAALLLGQLLLPRGDARAPAGAAAREERDRTPFPCREKYTEGEIESFVDAHLGGAKAFADAHLGGARGDHPSPQLLLVLGGSVAGKGTFIDKWRSAQRKIEASDHPLSGFVLHGLNEYLPYVPEYQMSVNDTAFVYKDAADACYESAAIPAARLARDQIVNNKFDVIYEETGKSTDRILKEVIPPFANAEYRVTTVLVHNRPEVAVGRAAARFQETGRYASDEYIRGTFANNLQTYKGLRNFFKQGLSEFVYCDNSAKSMRCWRDLAEGTELVPRGILLEGDPVYMDPEAIPEVEEERVTQLQNAMGLRGDDLRSASSTLTGGVLICLLVVAFFDWRSDEHMKRMECCRAKVSVLNLYLKGLQEHGVMHCLEETTTIVQRVLEEAKEEGFDKTYPELYGDLCDRYGQLEQKMRNELERMKRMERCRDVMKRMNERMKLSVMNLQLAILPEDGVKHCPDSTTIMVKHVLKEAKEEGFDKDDPELYSDLLQRYEQLEQEMLSEFQRSVDSEKLLLQRCLPEGTMYVLVSAPEYDLQGDCVLKKAEIFIKGIGGKNAAGYAKDAFHQNVMTPESMTKQLAGWRDSWKGKVEGVRLGIHGQAGRIVLVAIDGGPECQLEQKEVATRVLPHFQQEHEALFKTFPDLRSCQQWFRNGAQP